MVQHPRFYTAIKIEAKTLQNNLTSTSWYVTCMVNSYYHQATVVKTLDSAIHQINHYPVDGVIDFHNTYLLDSDLSGG